MELDFSRIIRLRKIKVDKLSLSEEENELSRPLLKDRSLIDKIYEIFKRVIQQRDCPPSPENVTQRKKFIFIVLYLYAPNVLAGGKMPKGLREDISKALNLHSACIISNNCSDVCFLYQNYSDFSNDIMDIFKEVLKELGGC